MDKDTNPMAEGKNLMAEAKSSVEAKKDFIVEEVLLEKKIEFDCIDSMHDELNKNLLSQHDLSGNILWNFIDEYKDKGESFAINSINKDKYYVRKIPIDNNYTNESCLNKTTKDKINCTSNDSNATFEDKTFFDIVFEIILEEKNDEAKKLIINIELQDDFNPEYPLDSRAVMYASRLVSSQLEREASNNQYGKMMKVYSIWIFTNPPKKYQNTYQTYDIQMKYPDSKLNKQIWKFDYLSFIMIYLGDYRSLDIEEDNQKDKNRPSNENDKRKCLNLLDKLFFRKTPIEVACEAALSITKR